MKKRVYYVEGLNGWFCVTSSNAKNAKREGIEEFGRGGVKSVRLATEKEVEYFVGLKGASAIRGNYE